MSPLPLKIIGVTTIGMALWGLMTGKVMAGARGLKANYYFRKESPFLFYGFIFIYLMIGGFVLSQS